MEGDASKPKTTSVETIFYAALSVSAADRENYLKDACGANEDLFQRVEALLLAHESAEGFLPERANEKSVLSTLPLDEPPLPAAEKPGDKIGRYKLLQNIGEGGCGVVYMAEQEEPVRRRVALKVIKLGMDTKQVVARFEAERQALALMDHANIAKVLDAGGTETGRPFFVMELVRGVKITDYCDQNRLSTDERLDLFVRVCRAIEHAHQKGIIHRDIKPSNILVTLLDGEPIPKVIDFGIAKATQGRLTDRTLFTAFEQFIGTPAYMSPEQAEMSGLDVDTRTDIYSLGVLLYELLIGKTPFDAQELLDSGLEAMRHTIRETEPTRPSTMLSTMLEGDLATAARHRRVEAQKLISSIRGDVEWIVMKCLDKDRARRYETATALAADVQRFMKNEPVQARPPSKVYLLQKLVRRHKFLFASAGAVSVALLIGLGLSTWLWVKERQARSRTEQAENRRERLRIIADEARKRAEENENQSKQVAKLLKDMLGGVGPSVALGRDTAILREILDKTLERASRDLTNQPVVEAELLSTMGPVYGQIAEYEIAEKLLKRALFLRLGRSATNDLAVAQAYHDLSYALWQQGKPTEAESTQRTALRIREEQLGPDHLQVARSLHALGQILDGQGRQGEAEHLFRRALLIRETQIGRDDEEIAESLVDVAEVLSHSGSWEQSEIMYRRALAMDRRLLKDIDPTIANLLHRLAKLLLGHEEPDEAEIVVREALATRIKLFGEDHPLVAETRTTLARVLFAERKFSEAQDEAQKAFASQKNHLNTEHPGLADTLNLMVDLALQRHGEAQLETLFRQLPVKADATGKQTAEVIAARGNFFARTQRWKEAAADYGKLTKLFPDDSENYHCLAPLLVRMGDTNGYARLCEEIRARFGSITNDPAIADRMAKDCLILPLPGVDRSVEARLADVAIRLGEGYSVEPWFQFCKGFAEYRQGNFPGAVEWMQKVLQKRSNSSRTIEAFMVLAMAEWQLNQTTEATNDFTKGIKVSKQHPADFLTSNHSFIDWIIGESLIREAQVVMSEPRLGDQTRP